jgi:hypothetical protein
MTKQRPLKLLDQIAVTNSPDDAEVAQATSVPWSNCYPPTPSKSNSSTATDERAVSQRIT